MFRRKAAPTIALLACLALSTAAYAQESTVRELNARGLKAFGEGRFADAAESFDRAYALDPKPELLKNEAVSWYKAERCDQAVEAAHQFLGAPDLKPADRDEISSLLGACKVKLAGDAIDAGSFELADRLLTEVEESGPDAVLADRVARVRIALARARSEAHDEPDEPTEEPDETAIDPVAMDASDDQTDTSPDEPDLSIEEPGPARRGVSGWPIIGLGAASLVGAGIYHAVMAAVVEPNFREAGANGDRDRYDRLDKTLRTANVLVPTLYGVGAATTAVGIWIVARAPREGETVALIGVSGAF